MIFHNAFHRRSKGLLLAARAPAPPQRDTKEDQQQAKEPALSEKRRHTAGRKHSRQHGQEGDDPPRHLFGLKDILESDGTEVKAEDGENKEQESGSYLQCAQGSDFAVRPRGSATGTAASR